MFKRCPGQDKRTISVASVRCPGCLRDVEIFSDEGWVVCPHCRRKIGRRKKPSCADWCKAASECLGEIPSQE